MASLIKSIFSFTYIKPRVSISGPANNSFVTLSNVTVTITIPFSPKDSRSLSTS